MESVRLIRTECSMLNLEFLHETFDCKCALYQKCYKNENQITQMNETFHLNLSYLLGKDFVCLFFECFQCACQWFEELANQVKQIHEHVVTNNRFFL